MTSPVYLALNLTEAYICIPLLSIKQLENQSYNALYYIKILITSQAVVATKIGVKTFFF